MRRHSLWLIIIVLSECSRQILAQLNDRKRDESADPIIPRSLDYNVWENASFLSVQEPVTLTFHSLDPGSTNNISFSLFQSTMSECSASGMNDDTGSLIWGPSIALTQYLVQHPYHVHGKTVWELGSGGGALPSLVSYRLGATQVVATDFQESTLQRTQAHASQNDCPIHVQSMDWQDIPNTQRLLQHYGTPDAILAADVIYGLGLVPSLLETLNVIMGPNTSLILAIREGREGIAEFRRGMVESVGCTEHNLEAFLDASYLPEMPRVFAEDPQSRDRWSGTHSIWMYQREKEASLER